MIVSDNKPGVDHKRFRTNEVFYTITQLPFYILNKYLNLGSNARRRSVHIHSTHTNMKPFYAVQRLQPVTE